MMRRLTTMAVTAAVAGMGFSALSVDGATIYWRGGQGAAGQENDFDVAANWHGGVIPGSGDQARFEEVHNGIASTKTVVLTQDQAIASYYFNADGFVVDNDANGPWKLSISTWSNNYVGTTTINTDLNGGNLEVRPGTNLVINGSLGNGSITKGGTLTLGGTVSNTGRTSIASASNGTLLLNKTGGAFAQKVSGSLDIYGTMRWLQSNQFDGTTFHLNYRSGLLDLNGKTDQIGGLFFHRGGDELRLGTGGHLTLSGGQYGDQTPLVVGRNGVLTSRVLVTGDADLVLETKGTTVPWIEVRRSDDAGGVDLDIQSRVSLAAGMTGLTLGAQNYGLNDGRVQFSHPAGSSYTQPTTVRDGHVLIAANTSGSATGTGAVILEAGGVLAGTGIVAPGTNAVTVRTTGAIAPGMSIGTLTVDGDVVFESDSFFEVEFDATDSDLLAVSGALDVSGATLNLTDLGGGVYANEYIIATYAGTLASPFAAVTGDLPANMTVFYDSGTIRLGVIPEPSALALVGLGVSALTLRRRRV